MSRNDYYGSVGGQKHWFVGVVKDVNDPKDSNRVRVRIKGIHPDDGDDTQTPSSSTGGGSTPSTTTGGGSTGSSISSPTLIQVDESKLPDSRKLSSPISNHFTLRDVTTGVAGSASRRTAAMGINNGQLTKEIIKNLAMISRNCLDPIKDKYGHIVITSGWRIGVSDADRNSTHGNHPNGYAIDFQVPGVSSESVASWIQATLKGRYNLLEIAPHHVHIQLGGTSRQGTTSNPITIRGSG